MHRERSLPPDRGLHDKYGRQFSAQYRIAPRFKAKEISDGLKHAMTAKWPAGDYPETDNGRND